MWPVIVPLLRLCPASLLFRKTRRERPGGGTAAPTTVYTPPWKMYTSGPHPGYVLCVLNGYGCRALIDTGSTISIVRPGILPGTERSAPTGWSATTMQMRTVTGERAALKGGKRLPVTVGMGVFVQDVCIMGLEFLTLSGACINVAGAYLQIGHEGVPLQKGQRTVDVPSGQAVEEAAGQNKRAPPWKATPVDVSTAPVPSLSKESCGNGAVKDLPPASVDSCGKCLTTTRMSLQPKTRTADERG